MKELCTQREVAQVWIVWFSQLETTDSYWKVTDKNK